MLQIWWMAGFLVVGAWADTPANCSYSDIQGQWTLYEGPRSYNNSETCTTLGSVVRKWKVHLKYPDIAVDQFGNTGFWTIVYNQGFEVTVNGRTYFAFSYYQQTKQNVSSMCDKTFPGWSHDVTLRHWACFYGRKVLSQPAKLHHDPFYAEQEGVVAEATWRSIVECVNSAHTSWRAVLHEPLVDATHASLLRLRGGARSWLGVRPRAAGAGAAVDSLPDSFDWRQVQGSDYVSPVRNQGGCGSCYAFSSTGMLESRLRVQTNNTLKVTLSPQDIVSCSVLSQGCEGGFPYLVAGRYARDYGVVTESCNPYNGEDGACSRKTCDRTYAASYSYVGGYYGACNEQHMMAALMQGPLSVSFEVYPDFMVYKGGVYQHNSSYYDRLRPWVEVNHAVLLVGYGVDEGTKYWTVKNSWGREWGEDGYFRILRGADECGIESIAVQSTPIP